MLDPIYDTTSDLKNLQVKLELATQYKKGGARKSIHTVQNFQISSWKFNEFDYAKGLVPCKARGLFTLEEKIVVRGYDKFFNMNEIPEVSESQLSRSTSGPYILTLKENGCIIFIGGLSDGSIIVCSKHSTGVRDDATKNHALEGERQLEQLLKAKGKTVEQLARLLYTHNVTLVAELCDDEFEEHILEYRSKDAGLYLHGINHNTIHFQTYGMDQVLEFAQEWGFKCVDFFQIANFQDLMLFLNDVKSTGTYRGREVEGFVIRTTKKAGDYFFKYKFEQPYLLYRNFREVTKQYLKGKPYNEILTRFKEERYIISEYVRFIIEYFKQHPEKQELFQQNFGVIELRKSFLRSLGLEEISGMNLLKINDELSKTMDTEDLQYKFVFIPIATIGCGKTTIGRSLANLFDWGHIQNDDLPSKLKTGLVTECLKQLHTRDAVVCDRNNHMKRERNQLFEQFYQLKVNHLLPNTALVMVCLNFIPPGIDKLELRAITIDRIVARGDKHQSIKSDTDPNLAAKVLNGFISRFQPLNTDYDPDSEFNHVINVDFRQDPEVSVKNVISDLNQHYPGLIKDIPSDEAIASAVAEARSYVPTFTKTFGSAKKKEKLKVDYFGIRVDVDPVVKLLTKMCGNDPVWQKLKADDRVQKEFHVTLAHMTSSKAHSTEWGKLHEMLVQDKKANKPIQISPVTACITLNSIVISQKLICIEVTIESTSSDIPIVTQHPHITIGTVAPEIKPYESNSILQQLSALQLEDIHKIPLNPPQQLTDQSVFSHFLI